MNQGIQCREPTLAEARVELQRVLSSRAFRQSKSLTRLLRYVCSRALLDVGDPTTEYTIAIDVLGKSPDFKDNKDASVRVEVHRLRKRLAEFYEQEGAAHPLRILIPSGQYVPQFLVSESCNGAEPAEIEVSHELSKPPENGVEAAAQSASPSDSMPAVNHALKPGSRTQWPRIAGLTAVLAMVAVPIAIAFRQPDALDAFWRPVVSSTNPILLCVGNLEGGQRPRLLTTDSAGLTVLDFHHLPRETMLVSDAATLSRFAGLLQAKGKHYRVESQSEATFADLRNSAAVLIGLANNDWTERLVGKLRFTLEHQPPGRLALRDRDHPERKDWFLDYGAPYLSITRDYALVVRVLDPKTEQMVVTAAGLSTLGTQAAGEFLTNPQEFRQIEAVAPKGWEKKNFEIVLTTDVIRGKSGAPGIVATHFW